MPLIEGTGWAGRIRLAGWVPGAGGERPVVEPATGAELGRIGLAGPADVARAGELAAGAQRDWAARSYLDRAAVLRKAGDLWQEHAAEVHEWLIRETGAIPPFAAFQTSTAAEECYEAAGLASQPYGELLRSAEPRLSLSRRLPAGVVGVIAPFNVPVVLSIRAVSPALALGNSVVLKPDPRTAVSGGVALVRIFEEAGLPEGLLTVLPGSADVGAALVTDPAVRVIAFTGSTRAGRTVAELAGKHLKRVHLELGGNSPLIVLDDADIDQAASLGAWGAFVHQGQVCMAASRHLVHESVVDKYTDALAERADRLPVGNPAVDQVALGPVIDEGQRDRIHEIVTDTVGAGARLAAGGRYEALFYRPTVLADVPPTSLAYTEEIFGPVAPVVAFSSTDEAAAMAAGTEYGLSVAIVSRDVMTALDLAERIPSGLVHINDQTVNDEATIPFGGLNASGTGGRLGGARANLDAFTETQWVTMRGQPPAYPF